jgi:hypothetical protein
MSQYLNNVVKVLELLLLTWVGGPMAVGLFAFAFQLSSQANVVIANQVSGVIQPVLSHINEDPARQFRAFVRALRLIGCIGVPISIIQGAIGYPVFRLLFGSKWDDAIPAFIALSVMQAFIFLSTPIMTLLKARGRFKEILIWQSLHVAFAGAAIWVLMVPCRDAIAAIPELLHIPATKEAALPLAAAIGGTLVWAIGCPIALRSGAPGGEFRWKTSLAALLQPWPAAIVLGGAVAAIPAFAGPWIGEVQANLTAIAVSVPASVLAVLLAAAPERQCRQDLRGMLRRVTAPIGQFSKGSKHWIV